MRKRDPPTCKNKTKTKMCGRCACTRDRETIQRACAFRPKDGSTGSSVVKPAWITANSQSYFPSYNIAPQSNTPVVISGEQEHVKDFFATSSSNVDSFPQLESKERVIQVMKWGLIPSWHKGVDARSFPTLLNNCRSDGMFDKPSFRNAISKRRRCVVLADGFYEWQRARAKEKKAFYIYPHDGYPTIETKELLENEGSDADISLSYNRMLTMAGYFDIWKPDNQEVRDNNDYMPANNLTFCPLIRPFVAYKEEVLYTYTVVTVDATEKFGSIHHRMPAILDTQEAISTWLDPHIPTAQAAASLINPASSLSISGDCLSWHPVSSLVNNVRNKSSECIVKVDHSAIVPSRGNQSILKWFSKSPKKTCAEEEAGGPSLKKIKSEK